MEFELYGENYVLVDYKINRNEEMLQKLVMIKNIDSNNTITFAINGNEYELENLNIHLADTIVSKVFNNLTSNEKFFYDNILNNDILLSYSINTTTNIAILGDRKFNEVKELETFFQQLNECQVDGVWVKYDDEKNSLINTKCLK